MKGGHLWLVNFFSHKAALPEAVVNDMRTFVSWLQPQNEELRELIISIFSRTSKSPLLTFLLRNTCEWLCFARVPHFQQRHVYMRRVLYHLQIGPHQLYVSLTAKIIQSQTLNCQLANVN